MRFPKLYGIRFSKQRVESPSDQVCHPVPQAAGRSTCGKKALIDQASSNVIFIVSNHPP
jgi:hypothetical protein